MKITKIGSIEEYECKWVGKCNKCGSEAEALEHELNITRSQRDGDFAWHKCPVCGVGPYNGICFYPKKTI